METEKENTQMMSLFAKSIMDQKYAHTKPDGTKESWDEIAERVVDNVMSVLPVQNKLKEKLKAAIKERKFIPGGRYLRCAGLPYHPINNCLLFRAEDSREGWADLMHKVSMSLMSGGGIGVVYSDIRAKNTTLSKTGGKASGPIPLMQIINEVGRGIMNAGERRCALWGGLHWNHPDSLEFTIVKDWSEDIRYMKQSDYNFPAKLDMTNISVILDDEFFTAYYKNDDKANKVYWSAIKQMLQHSEPGFSVDVGENRKENLRNACTEITSEEDSDVCNLGSINLARVSSLEEMKELVELGVLFLLAGTEYSHFPTKKSEEVKNKNRRLGLGIMGIHEWLLSHGYSYEPCEELEEYLKVYATSGEYADKWADAFNLSRPKKTRALAPVGSIGIIGETTTSIEPIFCVAYKRRYFKEGKWFYQYVVDPTAKRLIDKGISPDKIEDSYSLAQNVEKRVAFQAWVQQYVDHAISSTINLPAWGTEYNNESLVDSFGNMLLKYLPKLRGITVYADGSRSGQPLNPVKYTTAVKHVGEIVEESGDVCDISGKGGSCGG
jgi:ribonucleoside-diphosphate reductase alpha chain